MNQSNRMRLAMIVLLSGILCATCMAQPRPRSVSLPSGVKAERNIPYVEDGHGNQVLDLFLPEQAVGKPMPLMIWISAGRQDW